MRYLSSEDASKKNRVKKVAAYIACASEENCGRKQNSVHPEEEKAQGDYQCIQITEGTVQTG